MTQPDEKTQKLLDATKLTIDELRATRADWRPTHPMRRVINAEAARLIERARTSLETCDPSELPSLQGTISGIRELLAVINAQHQ